MTKIEPTIEPQELPVVDHSKVISPVIKWYAGFPLLAICILAGYATYILAGHGFLSFILSVIIAGSGIYLIVFTVVHARDCVVTKCLEIDQALRDERMLFGIISRGFSPQTSIPRSLRDCLLEILEDDRTDRYWQEAGLFSHPCHPEHFFTLTVVPSIVAIEDFFRRCKEEELVKLRFHFPAHDTVVTVPIVQESGENDSVETSVGQ